MQVVLIMFRADGERRSFSIVRDMTVVGRREDCDLRIPLGEVSRKHCRLIKDGESVRLEDLGSSNGTHHNGKRVQEAVLSPGDTVQVGPVTFIVQIDGVPAEDQMHPSASSSGVAGLNEEPADFEPVEEAPNVDSDAPSEQLPPAPPTAVSKKPAAAAAPVDEHDVSIDLHEEPVPAEDDEFIEFNLEDSQAKVTGQDHPA